MERCCDCLEQIGPKDGPVNSHPRSCDASFMIMMVHAAEVLNNCQAVKNIKCNIKGSRVHKDLLKNVSCKRKAYRGPQSSHFQETDKRVCEFVFKNCNKDMPITRAVIRIVYETQI